MEDHIDRASFTEMAVASIRVGARHRKDMGDIGVLAESIRRLGLLQPITVTPEDVLVCGARRLAAVKQLGWDQVTVCVRPGLSPRLAALMAERDENLARKQFTASEAATLYEEIKNEIAADAARRTQATQFAPGHAPNEHGQTPAALPPPVGDSRVQAAQLVGGPSHATLEKVVTLREVAGDTYRTPEMRTLAEDALRAIDAGEPVDRAFLPVRAAMRVQDLESIASDPAESPEIRKAANQGVILMANLQEEAKLSAAELDRAAKAALDRVELADRKAKRKPKSPRPVKPGQLAQQSLQVFNWMWRDHGDWPSQFNPREVGIQLTDEQWDTFSRSIRDGAAFWQEAKKARDEATQRASAQSQVASESGDQR